jgi:hypothetical protein
MLWNLFGKFDVGSGLYDCEVKTSGKERFKVIQGCSEIPKLAK